MHGYIYMQFIIIIIKIYVYIHTTNLVFAAAASVQLAFEPQLFVSSLSRYVCTSKGRVNFPTPKNYSLALLSLSHFSTPLFRHEYHSSLDVRATLKLLSLKFKKFFHLCQKFVNIKIFMTKRII